ncbi:hypothetical protein SELMODRAFT_417592 [Selaginella moellendorffii]|uniref:Uncharacterized protein n=1 Tax=Selaginella moellendorffii TaxID=88036 RepID=D8S2Y6_SELML|nr:hypothetical protein SELMODRAFT_417592 [Selaginella moellendorffii]
MEDVLTGLFAVVKMLIEPMRETHIGRESDLAEPVLMQTTFCQTSLARELGEWSYNQMRARPDRQYMIQLLSTGRTLDHQPTENQIMWFLTSLYQPIIQEINKYFETELGYVKTGVEVKQLNFITVASLEIKDDEEGDAIMGIFGYAMQRDHMIVYDLNKLME